MTEEEKELLKAASKALAEKVPPVYKDLMQPAVQQVGKALGTIAGVINLALAPIASVVWNYEQTAEWLRTDLEEKLKNVNPDDIATPKASIVGPAVESIKFLEDEPDLRNMFSSLIATSLNKNKAHAAHPGFVEIIKNLSNVDAINIKKIYEKRSFPIVKMLSTVPELNVITNDILFIVCEDGQDIQIEPAKPFDFINLERLGLIFADSDSLMLIDRLTKKLNKSESYKHLLYLVRGNPAHFFCKPMFYRLTELGEKFCDACILN